MERQRVAELAASTEGGTLPAAYGEGWVQKAWCALVDAGCVTPGSAWVFSLDGGARFAVAVKVPGRALYLLNEGDEPSHFAAEDAGVEDGLSSVAAVVLREAEKLRRYAARIVD
jgi:hypothetical protein